jgi:hypothetical protein
MKTLFLDFDGVLHPLQAVAELTRTPAPDPELLEKYKLFRWTGILARMLADHPHVRIVVHSAWRNVHGEEALKKLLGPLSPYFRGVTAAGPRWQSIERFVAEHGVEDWLVLDDDQSEFPAPVSPRVVFCEPESGLVSPVAQMRLAAWLSVEPSVADWPGDGLVTVAGIRCLLELGPRWSLGRIAQQLREFAGLPAPARLANWAKLLRGVPFQFESNLPEPAQGVLRVRLQSLDCATFVYSLIALTHAVTVESFIRNLLAIRYDLGGEDAVADSDPDSGNIFDFMEESLLEHAVAQGWLADVTEALSSPDMTAEFAVEMRRIKRTSAHDENMRYITPKRGVRQRRERFIRSDRLADLDASAWLDGDIVVFAKDPADAEGDLRHVMIRHLAVVIKAEDRLHYIHSSRNFAWRPTADIHSPPAHTGVFYDTLGRCEQLGVEFGGSYAGPEFTIKTPSDTFYGMDQSRLRTLHEYAKANFDGIKILRVLEQPGQSSAT